MLEALALHLPTLTFLFSLPLSSSSSLLTCQWQQMATRSWDSLGGVGVLLRKGAPGWAAGGRDMIQGFCRYRAVAQLPQPPSLLPALLAGSILESISLRTGLLKAENRINTAAGSVRSIFLHCASDRFTHTWGDSCLQHAEPPSQGEGGGRTKWDK